ncbi:hypothetical protein KBI51_02210 [Aerococcaceae bacterium zg-ZUI334]|uniref:hypothetical protein n=1 Tax=Aerococcaceae bacterium zg-252 TaxID=2796928 RepID=UPI001B9DEAA0|nr:hypothetical protein [Aerococcaceae bacterium zg-ZUI334]MBS4461838.1 hypothetical protein [Aerococcaceae bacterium zg-B36]
MNQICTYAYYQFKVNIRYKMNNIFSIMSTFVAILVQFYVWKYVEQVEHIDTNIISIYTLFALTFSILLPIFSSADFISSKILKGDIAILLQRPQSLLFMNFGIQCGHVLYRFCYRVLPIWLLYFVFFYKSIYYWDNPQFSILIILSSLFSWILSFILGYIVGLLSIQLISISGLKSLVSGLLLLFGGGLLPIDLYPVFLQKIVLFTPFASISYYPVAMLSGIATFNAITAIKIQLFWLAFFSIVLIIVHKSIYQKIEIMGG